MLELLPCIYDLRLIYIFYTNILNKYIHESVQDIKSQYKVKSRCV